MIDTQPESETPKPPSPLPYVSRRARKRVTHPLPPPTTCRFCGAQVILDSHANVYGGREYGRWPYLYHCTSCDARVGLHPHTDIPLGTLADGPTREARKRAKAEFTPLWKGKRAPFASRSAAYAWLADALGMAADDCHFALFDVADSEAAAAVCRTKRDELGV